jgi:hypothetical protein
MRDRTKLLGRFATTGVLLASCVVLAGPAFAQGNLVTVPAGTRILVQMTDPVDSSRNRPGAIFTARLQTNVMVGTEVVAPAGTTVHGRLTEARSGGRVAGRSELALELTDMVIDGTKFPLLTGEYSVQGSNAAGSTARRTAAGAGLGTAIGAIGGNTGRGAAIGSVMGASSAIATRGDQINIPAGTLLEFRLQQPAKLPPQGR